MYPYVTDPATIEQGRQERIARGWHAASYGAGKRSWFVTRETETGHEYVKGGHGRMTWFASPEAAQRRADALNRAALAD